MPCHSTAYIYIVFVCFVVMLTVVYMKENQRNKPRYHIVISDMRTVLLYSSLMIYVLKHVHWFPSLVLFNIYMDPMSSRTLDPATYI